MKREVSLCFHSSDVEIAKKQLENISEDLQDIIYSVRIRGEVHPNAYSSYSELVNQAINDCVYQNVILINDKVMTKKGDILRMLDLLEAGFGYVGLYSVGFCALTKSLIKKVGWFDERFIGGGYEDDDFLLRLCLNDIAIFDSVECDYDYFNVKTKQSVSVPLSGSEPHFNAKWKFDSDKVTKLLKEEDYVKYKDLSATEKKWLPWRASVLGYYYGVGPKRGIPDGSNVLNHHGHSRVSRFCKVPHAGSIVGHNRAIIDVSK
jgi:hypothetical protein